MIAGPLKSDGFMYPKDNVDIAKRVEEVKFYILDNNINHATRRLIDLSREFLNDKKMYNHALLLRKEYTRLQPEIRMSGYNEELRKWETNLSRNILELADEIYEIVKQEITIVLDEKHTSEKSRKTQGVNSKVHDRSHTNPIINQMAENSRVEVQEEQVVCRVDNLEKTFASNNFFKLSNISLELKSGEITGVVGENGNGKTTLLKLIAGKLAPTHGTISFPYLGPCSTDWRIIKKYMAYIPQSLRPWSGSLRKNLSLAASLKGLRGDRNTEEVEYIIYRLGLEKYLDLSWSQISGGYKTRFELARMLIWGPQILVLDEPLANLDINAQMVFLHDIVDLASSLRSPIAVIVSSQHLHEIESVATNILFLENGLIKHYGPLGAINKNSKKLIFEIAGKIGSSRMTRNVLYDLLDQSEVLNIEDTELCLTVHISSKINAEIFLTNLMSAGVEISYFRNISQSTKTLFRKNYLE